MNTYINEIIKVGVVFGGDKKVRPVWFVWKHREYRVKEITYSWTSRQGVVDIYHYAVSDFSGNIYELCYHARSMIWTLHQVEFDE